MRNAALGRIHSAKTKMEISSKLGNSINLFEKQFNNELVLISSFSSYRKAAVFLGISKSTVRKYVESGLLFKNKYKFTLKN